MSIGCRMRGLGVSSYYTKIIKPHLDEICGDIKYELKNSIYNGVIVHTDRIEDEKFSSINEIIDESCRNGKINTYNHNMEISWRYINKYAECTTLADFSVVNPDYKNDLTSDGEWVYPIPSYQYQAFDSPLKDNKKLKKCRNAIVEHLNSAGHLFLRSGIVGEVEYNFPNVTHYIADMLHSTNVTKVKVTAPNARDIVGVVWSTPVEEVTVYAPKATNVRSFADSCPKLKVANVEFPSATWASRVFFGTQLNKESVIRSLNSFPVYAGDRGNDMAVGIHVDHQNDEEVLAAIANVEAKGWAVTVQWNGTATSTSSMMRFGQLIYAKVDEIERPDGTTERMLDWGHYVTNPEGYETFRSLESAYEYFNLEMPISEV